MKHAYRDMPLTGAPAARFPKYLRDDQFLRFEDLDENGHAPETLDVGAVEHDAGCFAGWVDPTESYITDAEGRVQGFKKQDGSMASEEDLQEDARRYSRNWAADARFCLSSTILTSASRRASKRRYTKSRLPANPHNSSALADSASGDWY